jgi:hypothetical protein
MSIFLIHKILGKLPTYKDSIVNSNLRTSQTTNNTTQFYLNVNLISQTK